MAELRSGVRQVKQRQRFPLGDLVKDSRRKGISTGQLFDATVNYARLPGIRDLPDILAAVRRRPQRIDDQALEGAQTKDLKVFDNRGFAFEEHVALDVFLDYAAEMGIGQKISILDGPIGLLFPYPRSA